MEKGVVKDEGLLRFIMALEEEELINPITREEASASSDTQIQRETLQEYLDGVVWGSDRRELLKWARLTLYKKTDFHSVKGGPFQMGQGKNDDMTIADFAGHYEIIDTYTAPVYAIATIVIERDGKMYMKLKEKRFWGGEKTVKTVRGTAELYSKEGRVDIHLSTSINGHGVGIATLFDIQKMGDIGGEYYARYSPIGIIEGARPVSVIITSANFGK